VNSTKKSIDDIDIIRSWPGPSKEADEVWKAPSKIAYLEDNRNVKKMAAQQWGYQVTPKMRSYAWVKLLLDQETTPTKHDLAELETSQGSLLDLPRGKSATDVVSDYLKEVYQHTMRTLEQRLSSEILKITPIHYWFTVPAIWSDRAKAATRDAIKAAGFCSRTMDEISLITEPEAAAVATLNTMANDKSVENVRTGDGVLICDCGGGTVDITTYAIKSVSPLKFKELVAGAGGKCGSTYIDRHFFQWMSNTFGEAFENVPFDRKGPGSKFMREFETSKKEFGSGGEGDDYEVTLPMQGLDDHENYESDTSTVIISW
jgi:molecular chaperone DnaK (HSP70)